MVLGRRPALTPAPAQPKEASEQYTGLSWDQRPTDSQGKEADMDDTMEAGGRRRRKNRRDSDPFELRDIEFDDDEYGSNWRDNLPAHRAQVVVRKRRESDIMKELLGSRQTVAARYVKSIAKRAAEQEDVVVVRDKTRRPSSRRLSRHTNETD